MSWPAQRAQPAPPNPAELLHLLAAVGRLGQEGGGSASGPGSHGHGLVPPRATSAASAFHSYQPGPPPNTGPDVLSALQFWLELYQIAQNGLKNAMAQVAANPSLAGGLAALAPAQSPTASAALQLLSGMQSRNLGQQPLSVGHSDVSATTAVLAAAAGLPGAASPPGMAPVPDTLLAAAGLLAGGGSGGAVAARGGSAGAAAPDSQGAGAGGRDWSVDPGASDGSQERQRKRLRAEGGTQPTSHRSGKICSNCHTSNTPFWRKDRHTGLSLCNACGLYAAKNDHPRPVKLWREGQAGSPTQPPRQPPQQPQPQQPEALPQPPQPLHAQPPSPPPQQQQQQRSLAPVQPAVAQGPGPAQEQGQEASRAASPRAIAVAAAMQAVMRQAAAAQLLQQRQQQQPGSGSGSPQHCGSPAVPASQLPPPQPEPQLQPQPQAAKEERWGTGSPHVPDPAGAPSPAAAAGEAAACSLLQAAPQEDAPYRQAAATLLAATMGVLAQS